MADKTITDKRVVRTAPVEVSPVSTLPPGLDEGQYRVVLEDDAGDSGVFLSGDAPTEGGREFLLDTPENITIKSQTVRFGQDGTMFIDVVVSVSEVKGATDYELRTALAN